jgi:tRNA A37 threonylcarbamoyladenosine synthetase subunit TsaC/SUA5/YrdC
MCPLFQTSANLSGETPPSVFDQIPPQIVGGVDLAIDGGPLTGLPSTVVDIASIEEDGEWEILREGGLSAGDLAARMASLEP